MFVKIGRDDFECYVNVGKIESIGKRMSSQPCLPSISGSGANTFFIPPPPQFEYFLTMTGQHNSGHSGFNWIITEEDYKRVIAALEQGGGDYLFGD